MTAGRRLLRMMGRIPHRMYRTMLASVMNVTEEEVRQQSDLPLDVVIPLAPRHLPLLPLTVAAIRRHVRHPLRTVCVIAPPSPAVIGTVERLGALFLDENDCLPPEARSLRFVHGGHDRSGWLRQQLIKLSCDTVMPTEKYLVVDADTVFVRDTVFEHDGRDILHVTGDEYHRPYFPAYRRLLSLERRYPLSFVTHHMLFDRSFLAEMRSAMEEIHHRPWHEAIIDCLDMREASCFSEYETYGNFLYFRHRHDIHLRYWRHRPARFSTELTVEDLDRRFGGRYRFVSFQKL